MQRLTKVIWQHDEQEQIANDELLFRQADRRVCTKCFLFAESNPLLYICVNSPIDSIKLSHHRLWWKSCI